MCPGSQPTAALAVLADGKGTMHAGATNLDYKSNLPFHFHLASEAVTVRGETFRSMKLFASLQRSGVRGHAWKANYLGIAEHIRHELCSATNGTHRGGLD